MSHSGPKSDAIQSGLGALPFTLDPPEIVERVLRGSAPWPEGRETLHFRPGMLSGMSNAEAFEKCFTDPKVGVGPAVALRPWGMDNCSHGGWGAINSSCGRGWVGMRADVRYGRRMDGTSKAHRSLEHTATNIN